MALLRRRFKNRGVLALMEKIIAAHHEQPGKGLPIGALTSQHFANYYLDGLDRLLPERCLVSEKPGAVQVEPMARLCYDPLRQRSIFVHLSRR